METINQRKNILINKPFYGSPQMSLSLLFLFLSSLPRVHLSSFHFHPLSCSFSGDVIRVELSRGITSRLQGQPKKCSEWIWFNHYLALIEEVVELNLY